MNGRPMCITCGNAYPCSCVEVATRTPETPRDDEPCDSDRHNFRDEVYSQTYDRNALDEEKCLNCGWTWHAIAAFDRGEDPRCIA